MKSKSNALAKTPFGDKLGTGTVFKNGHALANGSPFANKAKKPSVNK